jgi:flavin reductase (DIM6/NTAB) family NADH-FMN oxidoreductase RutF
MYRSWWTRLRRQLHRLLPGSSSSQPSAFIRVAYKNPRQVVLVTTRWQERDNVWPMDWHTPLSEEPPLYGISLTPETYGAKLLQKSGEFAINFVPATWKDTILYCGRRTGRDVDKFARTGLQKLPGYTIESPRLSGARGVLECRVNRTLPVGDHTFIVGRVTHAEDFVAGDRLHHLDRRLASEKDSFDGSLGDHTGL